MSPVSYNVSMEFDNERKFKRYKINMDFNSKVKGVD
jgi:hypothetical protein